MNRCSVLRFCLVLALFPVPLAHAQETGSIAGMATAAESGAPLAGVTVTVMGVARQATTGSDGRYLIANVPPGTYRLQARLIGYALGDSANVVVTAGQTTNVNVQLQAQAFQLAEVVTVAYGEQKRVNLTSSVSAVGGEQLAKRPVASVVEALQAAAPGLTVIDRGGRPGDAGTTFFIRGRGTLDNTNPLVLIDDALGDINALDADDIESITVLKDAASTAIYGSRAANGIILVTTKRGANTGRVKLSYDGYTGMQNIAHFPERVGIEEYMRLINEARMNAGLAPSYSEGYIDSTRMAMQGVAGVDPLKYPNTDWLDVLWNPAPIQDHTLRLSGGSDLATFALSLNYLDQQGMMPNTAYERQGLRLNTDFRTNERFRSGVDLALRRTWDVEPNDMGGALFRMFHDTPPMVVAKYPAENCSMSPLANTCYGWSRNNHNPVAYAEASGRRTREYLHGTINAKADYDLLPGVTVRTLASVQAGSWRYRDWRNRVVFQDYWNPAQTRKVFSPNRLWERRSIDVQTYLRGLLHYDGTFGDHAVTALVGYDQTANDWEEVRADRQNFYNNELQVINAGDPSLDDNSGRPEAWRLRSGFGRVTYGWREKYLFEASARYDGSSRFAKGNRYGFFPSFSAGWRISQEPFMRDVSFVNELKVRGSWGRLGNQSVRRDNTELYYPYWSTIELGHTYSFGDQLVNGAAQTTVGNRNISWETTAMTDVGVDADLFGGRVSFTADVYRKDTRGILLTLPIPSLIGLNAPVQNAAKVRNTGWETSLTYRDAAGALNYSVAVNLSQNENLIVDLAGTGPYVDGLWLREKGYPLGTMYGYRVNGFFDTREQVNACAGGTVTGCGRQHPSTGPGDIRFLDQNGDGLIDSRDKVPMGNDMPRYTIGSTFTASYKNFDASVFWQGALDVDAYLDGALAEGPVWENYTTSEWLDRWTADSLGNPTNPSPTMPKPTLQLHINHECCNSHWVRDASYLKLKNVQIGYVLPESAARRLRLSRVRIYASGQNVLTLSRVAFLLDPEFPSGRGTVYPQTRTFTVGTSVEF